MDATFAKSTDFDRATFSDNVIFSGAIFNGWAGFEGVAFNGVDFHNTTFSNAANFVNTEMKGPTSFEAAKFGSAPPHFFGAKLHEGTIWRRVIWPVPKTPGEAGRYVDAYERLKLEMDRLKKHEDELNFFALELQSRRALGGDWKPISEFKIFGQTIAIRPWSIPTMSIPPSSLKLFGKALPSITVPELTIVLYGPASGLPIALYGLLCDYGRNYVRPVIGLLVTAVAGALLFWPHLGLRHFGQAFGLSIANTLGVLGFRKDLVDPTLLASLTSMLKVVAGAQTIAGVALLFLFSWRFGTASE